MQKNIKHESIHYFPGTCDSTMKISNHDCDHEKLRLMINLQRHFYAPLITHILDVIRLDKSAIQELDSECDINYVPKNEAEKMEMEIKFRNLNTAKNMHRDNLNLLRKVVQLNVQLKKAIKSPNINFVYFTASELESLLDIFKTYAAPIGNELFFEELGVDYDYGTRVEKVNGWWKNSLIERWKMGSIYALNSKLKAFISEKWKLSNPSTKLGVANFYLLNHFQNIRRKMLKRTKLMEDIVRMLREEVQSAYEFENTFPLIRTHGNISRRNPVRKLIGKMKYELRKMFS